MEAVKNQILNKGMFRGSSFRRRLFSMIENENLEKMIKQLGWGTEKNLEYPQGWLNN